MLRDLLEQEGIPTTVQGVNHGALFGNEGVRFLDVPLQVPEEHAARAAEILDALHEYDIDPAEDVRRGPEPDYMTHGPGPYRSTAEPEVPQASPRKPLVVVFAALILPFVFCAFGAGHFYVRSYGRGFALLALGWISAFFVAAQSPVGYIGLPLVLALDIAGALAIVRAARAGER